MTQDTRFVHLTAVSKQLFSYQCARTHWNMWVMSLSATFLLPREWVRLQQAATFLLPQQKIFQWARPRVKQCSPSGQLNIWATKVASARLSLTKVWLCSTNFHRIFNRRFHGYLSSGSPVGASGLTDRHDETNRRFFFATYAIELQKRRKLGFEELNYECAELKFWGAISTKNSVDVACIYVNW